MIDPRIYRAALLPALLAVLVAMFSVETRPAALPRGLAADELFDPSRALGEAEDMAAARGDEGGESAGTVSPRRVAESLATSGFESSIDNFEVGDRRLANVIGRRAGTAGGESQVVVVANREAAGPGGAAAGAADTAALLELGRALEGRVSRRTVTLVSLDGARLEEAGARRLVESLDPGRVEAVLAISGLGARGDLEPPIVPWSNGSTRASPRLERTAGDAVRQELGTLPGQETVPGQLLRLAFPLGIGAQGVFLDEGFQAIRFSGSGELPPAERSVSQLDRGRFGALGRAVVRTVAALDGKGLPSEAPETYLAGTRQLVPGWSVALVAVALLVSALVTVADGFARVGRRRGGVGAWILWALAGAAPFLAAYGLLRLLDLVGLVPGFGVAAAPSAEPPTGWSFVLLGAIVLAVAVTLLFGRRAVTRRVRGLSRPSDPGAGAAVALVVCLCALALWWVNPLAALFLVPAVHLWSWAAVATGPRPGLVLAMAGLVLPLAVGVFWLQRLSLGPLEGLWYGTLLVAGGQVEPIGALLGCLLVAALLSLLAVLISRAGEAASAPPPPAAHPPTRGPLSYPG
ncbi:MAG: hypothetical protein M3088_05300, partial [Actinomycetota bacterium]|nr:hypothetical protein [Actinomycetota bacterium]